MTVTAEGDVVYLDGDCGLDDVEALLSHLQAKPPPNVDLSRAAHLHGAILQALLTFAPPVSRQAEEPFVRKLTARLPTGDDDLG